MEPKNILPKKTKKFSLSINQISLIVPILIFISSIVVIGLIWYELTNKEILQNEAKSISSSLNTYDSIKLTNAELTERLEVIEDVLNRDQNISTVFSFVNSKINSKVKKIENISKSFEGRYEITVDVDNLKNGTDLYDILKKEVGNISDLRLEKVQRLSESDIVSYTFSFLYRDGLSK